ncbi:MAG: hypothetical protein ACRDGQ_05350, partial [Candidatus Limnocylindrales bacterium]
MSSTSASIVTPVGVVRRQRSTSLAGALAGLAAGAAGLAVGELIAGLVRGAPSLVTAVGTLVIALQPPGAKDFLAQLLGTNDKLALNLAVLVVALLVALVAGVLATRRFETAVWIFGAVGVVAAFAAVQDPLTSKLFAIIVPIVAVAAGLAILRGLLELVPSSSVALAAQAKQTTRGGTRGSEDLADRPTWRPSSDPAGRRAA